jgi:hypothetical protein
MMTGLAAMRDAAEFAQKGSQEREADARGAEELHLDFLSALRAAEIGDVLTDAWGVRWEIGEDGRTRMLGAP